MRYDLKTQLRLLAWSLGVAAIFSLLFGVLGLGSCSNLSGADGGGWCGIYVQKNRLGAAMAEFTKKLNVGPWSSSGRKRPMT